MEKWSLNTESQNKKNRKPMESQLTPKQKASDLVFQYRNILMDEDTECGNEILCTLIAIKCAKITASELVVQLGNGTDEALFYKDVINELDQM